MNTSFLSQSCLNMGNPLKWLSNVFLQFSWGDGNMMVAYGIQIKALEYMNEIELFGWYNIQ